MTEIGGAPAMKKISLLVIGAVLLILFALERIFPLREPRRALSPRLWVNFVLSVQTYAAATLFVRPVSGFFIAWSSTKEFGLVHWFGLPHWAGLILGFFLLDVSFYYWHRLNHVTPFLWRFHNVHHLDPDMDASTGFRFHFGEVALSAGFRAVQIVMIGPELSTFLIYELVFQLETYFHHSNLRLPQRLDRALNLLIVTPRSHGVHHSQRQAETDSNYSVVFSLWDRLHGTFRYPIPQSEITIGVPGYDEQGDNRIGNALAQPFRKQRSYWHTSSVAPSSKM